MGENRKSGIDFYSNCLYQCNHPLLKTFLIKTQFGNQSNWKDIPLMNNMINSTNKNAPPTPKHKNVIKNKIALGICALDFSICFPSNYR